MVTVVIEWTIYVYYSCTILYKLLCRMDKHFMTASSGSHFSSNHFSFPETDSFKRSHRHHSNYGSGGGCGYERPKRVQSDNEYLRDRVKSYERGLGQLYQVRVHWVPFFIRQGLLLLSGRVYYFYPAGFTTLSGRVYYFFRQGLLLYQAGFTTFSGRVYYFIRQGLLLYQAGFTTLSGRVYYFVRQGLLLCQAGFTTTLSGHGSLNENLA